MISHTGELTLTLRRSTQSKHVRLEKLIHPVWVTVLSMITLYPRHLHHILFNTTASVAVNSRSSTIWDGTGLIYAVSFMGRSFWLLLETLARVCAVNPLKVSNAHLASVVVIFQTVAMARAENLIAAERVSRRSVDSSHAFQFPLYICCTIEIQFTFSREITRHEDLSGWRRFQIEPKMDQSRGKGRPRALSTAGTLFPNQTK